MSKANPSTDRNLTRGQLAKLTSVNIETLRFYEQKGLLPKPRRSPTGYRQYSADMVARVQFIRQTKGLGFSLREIQELLSLKANPAGTSRDIKQRFANKIEDIEAKIRMLRKMRRILQQLVTNCPGKGPMSACPILESLK